MASHVEGAAYISAHNISENIVSALLAISVAQPSNPYSWLAEHFHRIAAEKGEAAGLEQGISAASVGADVEVEAIISDRGRRNGVSEPSDADYFASLAELNLDAETQASLTSQQYGGTQSFLSSGSGNFSREGKSATMPSAMFSEIFRHNQELASQVRIDAGDQDAPAAAGKKSKKSRRKKSRDVGTSGGGITATLDTDKLASTLKGNLMFEHLSEDERLQVLESMVQISYPKGSIIIKQGDIGDNFYVIEQGKFTIYKLPNASITDLVEAERTGTFGDVVLELDDSGSFGELALIYGSLRAATVVADTDCKLWAIDRETYRKSLMNYTMSQRAMYRDFLSKVPLLQELQAYEMMIVADSLTAFRFAKGKVIVKEGEPGDYFYIIVEGKCKVTQYDKQAKVEGVVGELAPGGYFGEISLLTDSPRQATVTAVTPVRCVGMDRARFNRVLGPCEALLRGQMAKYQRFIAPASK